jgi:hypothetical protein
VAAAAAETVRCGDELAVSTIQTDVAEPIRADTVQGARLAKRCPLPRDRRRAEPETAGGVNELGVDIDQ